MFHHTPVLVLALGIGIGIGLYYWVLGIGCLFWYCSNPSAELPLSANMLHYFAINDIHAKFSSAVV